MTHAACTRWEGGVLLLGSIVVGSGLVLDRLIPSVALLRSDMQVAHMIHAVAAVLMMALFAGHIYIDDKLIGEKETGGPLRSPERQGTGQGATGDWFCLSTIQSVSAFDGPRQRDDRSSKGIGAVSGRSRGPRLQDVGEGGARSQDQ